MPRWLLHTGRGRRRVAAPFNSRAEIQLHCGETASDAEPHDTGTGRPDPFKLLQLIRRVLRTMSVMPTHDGTANAAVTTTIRLRFDGRSTAYKGINPPAAVTLTYLICPAPTKRWH